MSVGSRNSIYSKVSHILVQGCDSLAILEEDACKDYFLKAMQKAVDKTGASVLAYVLMPTHAHLILKTDNIEELSKFMSVLSITYARFYNIVAIREGKVFEKRFLSEPIDSAEKFVSCLNFIHNNPVTLKLCQIPSEYCYSSYNALRGMDDSLVDVEAVNDLLLTLTKEQIDKYSSVDLFEWAEDETSKAENIDTVLKELLVKYSITNRAQLWNDEVLAGISEELMERCDLSIRKIAEKLQIGRETLRKIVAAHKNKK